MADYGFHKMNSIGQTRSRQIGEMFEELEKNLNLHFFDQRTKALCMTHLETACFFAKKSMALNTDNQDNG